MSAPLPGRRKVERQAARRERVDLTSVDKVGLCILCVNARSPQHHLLSPLSLSANSVSRPDPFPVFLCFGGACASVPQGRPCRLQTAKAGNDVTEGG